MGRPLLVVFLCSLGVDSTAAIVEYHERHGVDYSYGFVVVNRTPLSHPKLEEYAKTLTKRVNEKFEANLKLVLTEPDGIEVKRPPACRWVWKQKPTERFLKAVKHCVIVTGQRRGEGPLRASIGEIGTLYGRAAVRPVYNRTKTYCFRKAVEVLPELEETWRRMYAETRHTSLDCLKCLRRTHIHGG